METVRIYFSGSKLSVRTYILSVFPCSIFCVWNLISCVSAYSQTDLPVTNGHCHLTQQNPAEDEGLFFPVLSFFKRKEIFPRSSSNSPPSEGRWPGVHAHCYTNHWQGTKPPFLVYTSQNLLSEVRGRHPNNWGSIRKRVERRR